MSTSSDDSSSSALSEEVTFSSSLDATTTSASYSSDTSFNAAAYYDGDELLNPREDDITPDYVMIFLNHQKKSNLPAMKAIEWDLFPTEPGQDKYRPEVKYDRFRRRAIGRLRKKGFAVQQMKSVDDDQIYVKIWGPDWALEKHAESLEIKVQLKPVPSITKKGEKDDAGFAVYSVKHRDRFMPLQAADRLKIMYEVFKADVDKKGCGLPVELLISKGMMVDCFPPHDPIKVDALVKNWGMAGLSQQPLLAVRNYFGEQIGIYFAFSGYYTTWLGFPAALGLAVFIFGLQADTGMDNWLVPIYCVILALWVTFLLEFWRRTQSGLAFKWGTRDYTAQETSRPAFKGTRRAGFYTPAGFVMMNENDYKPDERAKLPRERYYEPWKVALKASIGMVILIMGLAGTIVTSFALLYLRLKLSFELDGDPSAPDYDPNSFKFGKTIAGVVNGVTIALLNVVFKYLGMYLNDWENHRTVTNYTNALILKIFMFQFVNSYFTLFYTAFLKDGFVIFGLRDECDANGCLNELTYQLATILITGQLIGQLVKVVLPAVKVRLRVTLEKVSLLRFKNEDGPMPRIPTYVEQQAKLEPFEGIIFEYGTKMIQFGYIALFAAAFPAGPLLAMLNNLIEIRADAMKLLKTIRRPHYVGADSIGFFYQIMQVMGFLAVLTNVAIISVVSNEGITTFVPGISDVGRVWAIVILEHAVLILKVFSSALVPDTPDYIAKAEATQQYQQKTILASSDEEEELSDTPLASDIDEYEANQRKALMRARAWKDRQRARALAAQEEAMGGTAAATGYLAVAGPGGAGTGGRAGAAAASTSSSGQGSTASSASSVSSSTADDGAGLPVPLQLQRMTTGIPGGFHLEMQSDEGVQVPPRFPTQRNRRTRAPKSASRTPALL